MLKDMPFEKTARHHTNINALLQVGIAGINTLHFTPRSRYFPHGSTSPVGLGLLIVQVPRSHSGTPHSVGILQKCDRPITEISTWNSTTIKRGNIRAQGGIRTRNPRKRAAANERFSFEL